jgi:deoxyribonuclease-4
MGDTLEELIEMRKGVKEKERVGFVCDTQHMFASGYDWKNNMEGVIKEINEKIGIENVKAVHINDSMADFNSHKDRHADLGEGKIGEESFKKILKSLPSMPFILETPSLKSSDTMEREILKLKKLAE